MSGGTGHVESIFVLLMFLFILFAVLVCSILFLLLLHIRIYLD